MNNITFLVYFYVSFFLLCRKNCRIVVRSTLRCCRLLYEDVGTYKSARNYSFINSYKHKQRPLAIILALTLAGFLSPSGRRRSARPEFGLGFGLGVKCLLFL